MSSSPTMMMSEPVMTNLLAPELKAKSDEILNMVRSKEAYLSSGFLSFLYYKSWNPESPVNASNSVMTTPEGREFNRQLQYLLRQENIQGYMLIQQAQDLFDNALPGNIAARNTAMNDVVNMIIENYNTPITAIGPAAGDVLGAYLRRHENVCKQILTTHYTHIRGLNLPGLQLENNVTANDMTVFVQHYMQVLSNINISYHQNYQSYQAEIIKTVLAPTNAKGTLALRNIFLSSFVTYFQLRYIASLIAQNEVNTEDAGTPRVLLVRRIAILSLYMCQYWFVYLVYLAYIRIDFSSNEAAHLRSILDNLSSYVFEQEKEAGLLDLGGIHKITQNNFEKSKLVNEKYQEIQLTRNNLNKAINNDQAIDARAKNARIIRILITVWVVTIIVALAALIYLEKWEWLNQLAGIQLIILVIIAFVSVVRG